MTNRFASVVALLVCLLTLACLGVPARAQDKPVGNVTMEYGHGGFLLSATGGKGTLLFNGRKYVFRVGGLGVGGVGLAKVTARGEVYNLKRVEDFPGAYLHARAGYAAVEGKGHQWLENANGVVMKLSSATKGLALSLGADGLMIEMGPIRK